MKPNIHKTESSMQKLKSDLHKMKLDPNMKMISLSSFSMVVHGGCGHNIDGGFHFSYINMETSARLSSLVGTWQPSLAELNDHKPLSLIVLSNLSFSQIWILFLAMQVFCRLPCDTENHSSSSQQSLPFLFWNIT